MAENKKINGKIEFLRFLFSVIIVIHHSRSFLGDAISPFLGGSLAVEYFFMVSGYLMMASIEKKNAQGKPEQIGQETARYLQRKWSAVIPESIISWVIAFAVMSIAKKLSVSDMVLRFVDGVWEPLFITMTGLGQRGVNGVVWYISAMLLSMAVLYPLLRKYKDVTVHLIIPLSSLLIFGFLFKNYGTPRDPTKWLGWTYKGVPRAFAEVGIGCLLYYVSGAIRKIRFNRRGKCLISLTENACYLVLIAYMYLLGANKHDYFFIAMMAVAVALTFSEAGIDNRFFNNSVVYRLGRFSVPLYFSHTFWASYLNAFVPTEWRIRYRLLIYVAISFATAWLVMVLAKKWRTVMPKLAALSRKYLTEPDQTETSVEK